MGVLRAFRGVSRQVFLGLLRALRAVCVGGALGQLWEALEGFSGTPRVMPPNASKF